MAGSEERWTGDRPGGKTVSKSRSRSRSRRNLSPPRHAERPRSPAERRRQRSPDDRRRRRRSPSRSRSRSAGRRDRDARRERSPPRRRERSPPSRQPGYGSRRGGSRSRSPPRRRDRSPPGRDGGGGGYGGRRGDSRSPPPPMQPVLRGAPLPPQQFPGGGFPPGGFQPGGFRQHHQQQLSDAPPEVGSIHRATVASVRPFGAFVELPGFRKQALVHNTQVSEDIQFGRDDEDEDKVKALEFFLPRGEKVWVKILEVRQEPGGPPKLAASMRAVSQEDGTDLDPDNALAAGGRGGPGGAGGGGRDSDEPPELYSIHKAAVQQVRPFGVFVKMDGYRKYGLVHFSQISDHLSFTREDADDVKVKEIGEILSVGDPVWVKVVDLTFDERGAKIGCSIKHVSQADGTDLDPANTKYRPRGEGGGGPQTQQPIGAAAGAAHDGAVDWGHLKADVVQYGNTKQQYAILADSGDEGPGPSGRGRPLPPQRPGPPPGPLGGGGGGFGSGANMAPMPSRGRGGGAVLPAWMTGGGGAGGAPGSSGPPPGDAPAAAGEPGDGGRDQRLVTSVEHALAILEEHARSKKDKKKKHKKEKKSKHKKEKKSKRSKEKRSRRSGSDSSSDSD